MDHDDIQSWRAGSESSPIDCIEEKGDFSARPPTCPLQNQTLVERLRATVTMGLPDRQILLEAADEIARLQGLLAYGTDTDAYHKLRNENERQAVEIDRLELALHSIESWSRAYPLSVFPEPDLKKAAAVLKANEMTLDAISAHCMRHVVEGVGKIARAALAGG